MLRDNHSIELFKKEVIDNLNIKSFFLNWLAPSELNLADIDNDIIEFRCSHSTNTTTYPWHSDHPLRLFVGNSDYKCKVCDRKFDIFNFFQQLFNVPLQNAYYAIAKEANVDISKIWWIRTRFTTQIKNGTFIVPNYEIHLPVEDVYSDSGWFKRDLTRKWPKCIQEPAREYWAKCPFDDYKRSHQLIIYVNNGDYNCEVCGKRGNMINFYQNRFNVDYETACKELSKYKRASYRSFKRIKFCIKEKDSIIIKSKKPTRYSIYFIKNDVFR